MNPTAVMDLYFKQSFVGWWCQHCGHGDPVPRTVQHDAWPGYKRRRTGGPSANWLRENRACCWCASRLGLFVPRVGA